MKLSRHKKLSNIAKKSNFGGYYENSIVKYRAGTYKNIHCDSSWELAFVVYCIEHNIDIKRCNEVRTFNINGENKRYYPDFVVGDQIIEIKGYYSQIAKAKSEQNPDIKVLLKSDMKKYLNYTIEKYGNKFWEVLYE